MPTLTARARDQGHEPAAAVEGCGGTRPEPAGAAGVQLVMPQGLVGFPAAQRFLLLPLAEPERRFMALQSADGLPFGFVVLPVAPDDGVVACGEQSTIRDRLGIAAADLALMLIVTVRRSGAGTEASVNLRAPLFVDTRRRLAWQVVQRDPDLPVRLVLHADG